MSQISLLLVFLGVVLFFCNSPSMSLLLSLVFSLLSGVLVCLPPLVGGSSDPADSLFSLLGVLIYSGGVFVIMSFVIFSSHSDFEKPFSHIWVLVALSLFLFFSISSLEVSGVGGGSNILLSGSYLLAFFFILLLLFSILFSIFTLSEEKKESFFL